MPLPLSGDRLRRTPGRWLRNDGFDRPVPGPTARAIRSSTSSTSSRRTAPTTRCSATCGRATATRRCACSARSRRRTSTQLAREFVTLDNFYANAEVSAQGWNWSVRRNCQPLRRGDVAGQLLRPQRHLPLGRAATPRPARTATARTPTSGTRLPQAASPSATTASTSTAADKAATRCSTRTPTTPSTAIDLACPDNPDTFTPGPRPAATRGSPSGSASSTSTSRRRPAQRRARPAAQRPHLGHQRRRADADGVRRGQRPGPRPAGRGGLAIASTGRSTAIFVIEDDAQNGPDHVDAPPHRRAW